MIVYFCVYCISTASPALTVPADFSQCTEAGQSSVLVTWAEVTATNTDGQVISCTYDNEGIDVPADLTGGDFTVGIHTVTCSVNNGAGCTTSASFILTVSGMYIQCFFRTINHFLAVFLFVPDSSGFSHCSALQPWEKCAINYYTYYY